MGRVFNVLTAVGFLVASVVVAAASDPFVINGQSNQTYSNLSISSTSGPCVQIINSMNITIEGSQIGPCGDNNTTNNSQGILISGGSGINVYDNYIHVENLASECCDSHDGVLTNNGAANVVIKGNVIAFNESNIEAIGNSNGVTATGNFLLNPRGPFPRGAQFQSLGTNMLVENNYTISSTDPSYPFSGHQEDAINFYQTTTFTAQGNYVTGGQSSSGCGINIDKASNNGAFKNNLLHNTGQCGIGVGSGVGHLIVSNKVLNENPIPRGGNTAMSVWKQYPPPCGGTGANQITLSNNIADERRLDGTHSGFWNGGGCNPLNLVNNTFGTRAYKILHPWSAPAPAIPPLPVNCVAVSPYTNNTTKASCSGGSP